MAATTLLVIGGETVSVVRIGREYAIVRADGSVEGHRTWPDEHEATRQAIRLSNRERAR